MKFISAKIMDDNGNNYRQATFEIALIMGYVSISSCNMTVLFETIAIVFLKSVLVQVRKNFSLLSFSFFLSSFSFFFPLRFARRPTILDLYSPNLHVLSSNFFLSSTF